MTHTYIINYFYDDNKLITEIKDNIRNDYIYDEYNELYGFIQNNTNIYYYVRDYIGNILGIVDNLGNLIVKYDYDDYGNTISITGENIYNPFIYKGYYYDNDIEMYYCHNRFYNPKWRRWLTPDSLNYLNIDTPAGMNLFIYCNNNPVMYSDGDGSFPILACILGLTALVGIGLTIGGVASDNNVMTAIGLSMVAVPALISGGIAIATGIGGATLTGVVGGVTVTAGLGTGLFATAEYQQTFTGNNWMLDAGMNEGWYNGLMLTTASLATIGTFASSFCSSFNIKSIQSIGKVDNYYGVKFNLTHIVDNASATTTQKYKTTISGDTFDIGDAYGYRNVTVEESLKNELLILGDALTQTGWAESSQHTCSDTLGTFATFAYSGSGAVEWGTFDSDYRHSFQSGASSGDTSKLVSGYVIKFPKTKYEDGHVGNGIGYYAETPITVVSHDSGLSSYVNSFAIKAGKKRSTMWSLGEEYHLWVNFGTYIDGTEANNSIHIKNNQTAFQSWLPYWLGHNGDRYSTYASGVPVYSTELGWWN